MSNENAKPIANNAKRSDLLEVARRSPTESGCYIWKDATEKPIYVGKARNIRNRLLSYFRVENRKTGILMQHACSLEWIVVENSGEALALESDLIKKLQPRYNVRLKDDKGYPYLCITLSEPYPRLIIARGIHQKGNRYFGPYTDVRAIRNTTALIHKIFPIRKTPLKLPLKKPGKPCMNYHIKRCLAPCRGDVPEEEYNELIKEIILFLEGKSEILENRIRDRMKTYAARMDYEKAAIYRDALISLRSVEERRGIAMSDGKDLDILGYSIEGDSGQMAVFEIRDGKLIRRSSFPLIGTAAGEESEILSSFIRDRYTRTDALPRKIIVPSRLEDTKELEEFLSEKSETSIRIQKGRGEESSRLLRLARNNAQLLLRERLLATRSRDRKEALLQLQKIFALKDPPEIIECYDISHLQGSESVASGVLFLEGNPYPSGYRRYHIKGVKGINDPAMIHEAVSRRLQRLLRENRALPDIILIDGGLTQLKAAVDAAESLGIHNLAMAGLAKKREELYFPGESKPRLHDPRSEGLLLLRHARDEAHRFGLAYHRQRRNNNMLRHLVESVPDVGSVRKGALLKHFRDKKLGEASIEELQKVNGIGPGLAHSICNFFKGYQDAAP